MDCGDEDFRPLVEIAALRQQRWESQRAYVIEHSPFFGRLWKGQTVPDRLEELAALPLCNKTMLRESQADSPPFGDYLAAEPGKVVRLHRTSGTTGQAMNIAQTRADAEQTARIGGRALKTAGLGPKHMVAHCLNYQMWMGGVSDHLAVEATGATVVPFGVGNTELLVRTILDLNITAIHCTPSYPAVLEQTIADRFSNLTPRELGLKIAVMGGEAGLDNPSFRTRLEDVWGFTVRNANYGVSDVFSNFASQCSENHDLHFVGHDVLHVELIEPESGDAVPWDEGATGELVLTHVAREAQPMVRFRTNDTLTVTGMGTCRCGRTTPRFKVLGRSDDMVVIRGINVFPTAVGEVINGFKELSGEYCIRLKGPGPYDRLPVEAELGHGAEPSDLLVTQLVEAIKAIAHVSATVTLLPPLALPRSEGKTQRLFRED